ncbi:tyrosine-type recombinase/integrase [Streptobacillus moniliformis]|uniref:tyrosine-type recombinase/integrase n=1 Tax=Streptobacillus moniliformis TaxID=34105 RepID=UPI0007E30C51|nr:site-specific integrase [Streptobacillus moniliformis]
MVKKGRNGTYTVESEVWSKQKSKVIKVAKRGFLTYIDAKNYDDMINLGFLREGIPMKRLIESFLVYKTPYLKAQTLYNLKSKLFIIFANHLTKPFNKMDIHVMDNLLYEMRKQGRCNSYINKAILLFKQLSIFANTRYEGKNDTYKHLKALPEESSQRVVITYDMFKENIEKVTNIPYKMCLKVLHGSMCRMGEILALQKKDIIENGLEIYKSRNPFGIVTSPKTKSSTRIANISRGLYNELMEYVKDLDDEDYPFGKINRKTLLKTCKKYLGCPVHDLRASMSTTLLEKGANLNDISCQLGHSGIGATLHYLRITTNSNKNISNLLDKIEME